MTCIFVFCALSTRVNAQTLPPLFPKEGIGPQAVRQGTIGSCYFHSAIAGMAETPSTAEAVLELSRARAHGNAIVAATSEASLKEIGSQGTTIPSDAAQWYVSGHAYTVTGYNGLSVTLRDPWGHGPDSSKGAFTISIAQFTNFFPFLFLQK